MYMCLCDLYYSKKQHVWEPLSQNSNRDSFSFISFNFPSFEPMVFLLTLSAQSTIPINMGGQNYNKFGKNNAFFLKC